MGEEDEGERGAGRERRGWKRGKGGEKGRERGREKRGRKRGERGRRGEEEGRKRWKVIRKRGEIGIEETRRVSKKEWEKGWKRAGSDKGDGWKGL